MQTATAEIELVNDLIASLPPPGTMLWPDPGSAHAAFLRYLAQMDAELASMGLPPVDRAETAFMWSIWRQFAPKFDA